MEGCWICSGGCWQHFKTKADIQKHRVKIELFRPDSPLRCLPVDEMLKRGAERTRGGKGRELDLLNMERYSGE